MDERLIETLELQVSKLVDRCAQLQSLNEELEREKSLLTQEREQLTEKNRDAILKVEAMVAHLKNLETIQ